MKACCVSVAWSTTNYCYHVWSYESLLCYCCLIYDELLLSYVIVCKLAVLLLPDLRRTTVIICDRMKACCVSVAWSTTNYCYHMWSYESLLCYCCLIYDELLLSYVIVWKLAVLVLPDLRRTTRIICDRMKACCVSVAWSATNYSYHMWSYASLLCYCCLIYDELLLSYVIVWKFAV